MTAASGDTVTTGGPRGRCGSGDSLVAEIRDLSGQTDERIVHLPDTSTTVIFRTTSSGGSDLLVAGPRTRASYYVGKPLPTCLILRLAPGTARSLVGPIGDLVDRVVPLTDIWGLAGLQLTRELTDLSDATPLLVERLVTSLHARYQPENSPRGRLIRRTTKALASPAPARLPHLARELSVSERHLRAALIAETGLPPKRFTRIARLRAVLAHSEPETFSEARSRTDAETSSDGEAWSQAPRWADVAATTGYYDQSHMTADFRSLMGVTPGAYFTGHHPRPLPCHA